MTMTATLQYLSFQPFTADSYRSLKQRDLQRSQRSDCRRRAQEEEQINNTSGVESLAPNPGPPLSNCQLLTSSAESEHCLVLGAASGPTLEPSPVPSSTTDHGSCTQIETYSTPELEATDASRTLVDDLPLLATQCIALLGDEASLYNTPANESQQAVYPPCEGDAGHTQSSCDLPAGVDVPCQPDIQNCPSPTNELSRPPVSPPDLRPHGLLALTSNHEDGPRTWSPAEDAKLSHLRRTEGLPWPRVASFFAGFALSSVKKRFALLLTRDSPRHCSGTKRTRRGLKELLPHSKGPKAATSGYKAVVRPNPRLRRPSPTTKSSRTGRPLVRPSRHWAWEGYQ